MEKIPASLIREQLERIIEVCGWAPTNLSSRFLRYVVEETLAGRSTRIKAYTIAVTALDRPSDFDPQLDSTVRVLAGRVRQSLEKYYLSGGQVDSVHISIPSGSYVPSFAAIDAGTKPPVLGHEGVSAITLPDDYAQKTGVGSSVPSIKILKCGANGFDDSTLKVNQIFDDELFFALKNFEMVDVRSADDTFLPTKSSYYVESRLCTDGSKTRLHAKLISRYTGICICACAFDLDGTTADIIQSIQNIASDIASQLAEPFGYIHHNELLTHKSDDLDALSSYHCILQAHYYYAGANPLTFAKALRAARRATEIAPHFAAAWAALADLYCEDYRLAYSGYKQSQASLERAKTCALKALKLNNESPTGHLAYSTVLFSEGRLDSAIEAGDRAVLLNPVSSIVKARYGQCRAFAGDWDEGAALVKSAMSTQKRILDYQFYVLAEHAFTKGKFQTALDYLGKTPPNDTYYQPMFRAANLAGLGYRKEAGDEIKELLSRDPSFTQDTAQKTLIRDVHQGFVHQVVDGLADAGLSA